jgi:adenylosuccinate lyase
MQQHIDESYDTHWTQAILHQAILQGFDRDEAYRVLQASAFNAIEQKTSMLLLLKSVPMFENVAFTKWIQSTTSMEDLYERVFK